MSNDFDVLIFSAHPDDAEMAMGGTLLKLSRAGFSLLHVTLTKSDMSTYGDVAKRELEFQEACKRVGCSGRMLDFKDTRVENTPDNRLKLAEIIREAQPKIVFAPYHSNSSAVLGGIANVDHYATGALVRDAVKMARLERTVPNLPKHTVQKVYLYMLPRDVKPNIYVDVTDVMEDTLEVIRAYESQMKIEFMGNNIEYILTTRRASAGIDIGVKYAETFAVDMALNFSAQHFFEV